MCVCVCVCVCVCTCVSASFFCNPSYTTDSRSMFVKPPCILKLDLDRVISVHSGKRSPGRECPLDVARIVYPSCN